MSIQPRRPASSIFDAAAARSHRTWLMRFGSVLLTWITSIAAVCQVPPLRCDPLSPNLSAACALLTSSIGSGESLNWARPAAGVGRDAAFSTDSRNDASEGSVTSSSFISVPKPEGKLGFHWGRALLESFELLSIEQAYVVHDDWKWVGGNSSENGIPFNHYWRDYKQSLASWVHSGWNDSDPLIYGYVGHPIQGVATSYIYLQNDRKSEKLEFSKSKEYWRSRLMATLWNAAYSTQWNIGPISEATVEKYGTLHRDFWNRGNNQYRWTSMGQIDLVMTPVGGFGWLVGEDVLDRFVTRRVEGATRNRFLIDFVRCGLDPIRIGTNLLHGKRPWYRASRDAREVYYSHQLKKFQRASVPDATVESR